VSQPTLAKIGPAIGFHILRHTYPSRLAIKGAPLPVIAARLGHSDPRITEKHYAHLAPALHRRDGAGGIHQHRHCRAVECSADGAVGASCPSDRNQ
jgi:site-specific recombinase XerD